MRNLNQNYYNYAFSHIYVEQDIKDHPRTKKILSKFPDAVVIGIRHYKDIFCRRGQDFAQQHRAPALVLAAKKGTLCYQGASVCQSFGNQHFYYTSCVMNCIYSCEYCYLRGMYPSGNLVVFVNIEDTFDEVVRLLAQHPVYLCISYDTDLVALEDVTGFVGEWARFAQGRRNLHIEVRTKCGRMDLWEQLTPIPEMIYAFTMSPQKIVEEYEHHTSSLETRIASAAKAQAKGFLVRLCFDPMIYCPGWREQYGEMLQQIFASLDMAGIQDVSVGSFRIAKDYLKKMRKMSPDSAVIQYPFEQEDGVCHYPAGLMREMEQFLCERLREEIPEEKIFCW